MSEIRGNVYNELRSIINLNTKQTVLDAMKLILAEETIKELDKKWQMNRI